MGNLPRPNLNENASKLIKCKAQKLVGQYGFTLSDREDVEQDLALHLIERAEQIDLESVYKTVLNRILDRRIVSMLRHRFALVRDKKRDTSLEAVLEQCAHDGYEIADHRYADSETESHLETDVRDALESLDDDTRSFCELLKHHSVIETAKKLGLTRGKTRGHITKMRALLTGAGLDAYLRK